MDNQSSLDLAVKVHRLMMQAYANKLKPNAVLMPSQVLTKVKAEGEGIVGALPDNWVVEYMGLRVIEVPDGTPVGVATVVWEDDPYA